MPKPRAKPPKPGHLSNGEIQHILDVLKEHNAIDDATPSRLVDARALSAIDVKPFRIRNPPRFLVFVDSKEQAHGIELCKTLLRMGIYAVSQHMEVGDIAIVEYIGENEDDEQKPEHEKVLADNVLSCYRVHAVIERKEREDFRNSIRDGRRKSQRAAMVDCGVAVRVWLVVGYVDELPDTTMIPAMNSAMDHDTFGGEGLKTRQVRSAADVPVLVSNALRYTVERVLAAERGVNAFSGASLLSQGERRKALISDPRNIYNAMLSRVSGLSEEKADAIIVAFPTMLEFTAAVAECAYCAEKRAALEKRISDLTYVSKANSLREKQTGPRRIGVLAKHLLDALLVPYEERTANKRTAAVVDSDAPVAAASSTNDDDDDSDESAYTRQQRRKGKRRIIIEDSDDDDDA